MLPCSDLTRARGDDLAGSAGSDRGWILVEQDTGWERDVWAAMPVSPEVRERVDEALAAAGARFLTIRRPGRNPRSGGPRRWAAVLTDPEARVRQVWGSWSAPDELAAAADALTALRGGTAPASATDEGPLLLVCTHARRDQCCAVRGRPIAAALAARWPGRTWECSHVGGHRFAGNVLVLPEGASYGALDADSAVQVVEDHLAGRVRGDHLRGFTGADPAVQAALVAVYRERGPFSAQSLRTGPAVADGGGWRIPVTGPQGGGWQVAVRAEELAAIPVSCGKPAEPVRHWLTELTEPTGPN